MKQDVKDSVTLTAKCCVFYLLNINDVSKAKDLIYHEIEQFFNKYFQDGQKLLDDVKKELGK